MRKVDLRMNELQKYQLIKDLVDKNGNKKRCALKLNCTIRTINRLIIKYHNFGKAGFIHGNRGKSPIISKPTSLVNDIITLYDSKYSGSNFEHFHNLLQSNENINVSYKFIYNTLMLHGFISPKIQRKTKRRLTKEKLHLLNSFLSSENLTELINHEVDLQFAHPRKERAKYFGEEIQMDASSYLWFGNNKSNLHLSIDDNSGTVTAGYFDKEETLFGYYNVLKLILENYGIPSKFKTDNRTVFNYMRDGKSCEERDVLTQFGYACKTLGIDIITTSVAQAKGRVERLNQSFQSRLPIELRIAGITKIEEANEYLKNIFIPNYNRKFALPIDYTTSVFENIPSQEKINETLAIISTRIMDSGNSIKYKNKYYQPYENDKIKCFSSKTECLVIKCFNGDLLVTIDNFVYELRELNVHKEFSKDFDEIVEKQKNKTKYIPAMNHPWRSNSFKKHVENAHNCHIYA